MSKKFATLSLSDTINEIEMPALYKKFSDKMIYKYIIKNVNPTIETKKILDVEGYSIKLPLTKDFINDKNKKIVNEIMTKSLDYIQNKGVVIIEKPKDLLLPSSYNLYEPVEQDVMPLLICKIIQEAIDMQGIDIKNAKILLITGDNVYDDYIIEFIYNELNYLTIATKDVMKIEQKAEEIFNKTGLNIIVKDINKFEKCSDDIIINLQEEKCKLIYGFKRNAVFIDISDSKINSYHLQLKKRDITVIKDFELEIDNNRIKKLDYQMILYINHYLEFKKYISGNIKIVDIDWLKDLVNQQKVGIKLTMAY